MNDNEVLNFGFDDFNQSFSMISVQAKDLYIYHIDFINHEVVRKLPDQRSVIWKSIFYNIKNKDKMLKIFEETKEFIQQQEAEGHKVLLPKTNEDIIAILPKDSILIKIYSIQH